MIRDEFQSSQKKRKQSIKEIEGIKKMGERGYYTMSIKKLEGIIKPLKTNTLFMLFFGFSLLVLIIVSLMVKPDSIKEAYTIIAIMADFIMLGWVLAYFLFVKRAILKKIQVYKDIVEESRLVEMQKKKGIIKTYENKEKE